MRVSDFVQWLLGGFVRSSRFHLRQETATDTRELIALFDRFLDGKLQYPLEWDDFISWKATNPHVEAVRQRLGQLEDRLFSSDQNEKLAYCNAVIEERNQLAALVQFPQRPRMDKL